LVNILHSKRFEGALEVDLNLLIGFVEVEGRPHLPSFSLSLSFLLFFFFYSRHYIV